MLTRKQAAQMLAALDRVLASGTITPGLCLQLGSALLDGGQAEEASGYFDQGLSLAQPGSEEYGELLLGRAAAAEYSGDFAGALERLEQYERSFGQSPEVDREIRFLETR